MTEGSDAEAAGEDEDPVGDDLEDIAEAPDGEADPSSLLEAAIAGDLDAEAVEPDPALEDRVEDAEPETVATELAALRERIETLEARLEERDAEVDDLESRLARKQADFQNYKKRQEDRLAEEKARATEALVERLLDVRDNLQRALDQDADADIRGGVESTLRQFDAELERENVERIEPQPGEEPDPQRHEILMRVESDEPEGTVADLHRPGYEMAGKVLRAAQVTVSEGSGEADGA